MCLHGLPALRRLVQRRSHLEPQLGTDRSQQVVRWLSADELQLSAGVRRQMQHLVLFVHDQRRRTVLLQELLVEIEGLVTAD